MSATATVAPGVHRLGSAYVNFYLVESGDGLTLVDAGLPGYFSRLETTLRDLGRTLADIDAVVLTHGHVDHVGVAERVRTESPAPVWIHPADETMARTAKPQEREGGALGYLRHPALYRFLFEAVRHDPRPTKVAELSTFPAEGGVLDVPGRPRAVPTPGHSKGHCALLLEEPGVLLAGDALCTYNPLTGARGPQLLPTAFANSVARALESLDAVAATEAGTVLPGHGEPWTGGARAAAERARATGPT
jgi:glyoxylase-like metal-dependent hydrolase (beta-lactamase superfamily II)